MPPITCPNCSVQVTPLEDGTCPACRAHVIEVADDPADAQTADNEPDGSDQIVVATDVGPGRASEAAPSINRPAGRRPTKLGVFEALGWCLILLLAQLVASCLLGVVLVVTGLVTSIEDDLTLALILFVAIGDLLMVAISWNNLQPDAARKLAIRGISVFHVLIVLLLVLPLSVLCEDIANRIGAAIDMLGSVGALQATALEPGMRSGVAAYTGLLEDQYDAIALLPWAAVILVGCVLPGICEEMFFRGFLGRGLLARYGAVVGITLTSLFFGLFHIDPVHACYAFVIGIVLHCVYLWTRTLWAPVLLHITFNLLGFSTHKLSLEGTIVFGGPGETVWIPLWLSAAALLTIIALGYVLYQSRVRFCLPDEEQTVWSPGYAAASTPPAASAASARRGVAGRLPVTMAAGTYLAFGIALIYTGSVWFDPNSAWAHLDRGYVHSEQEEYVDAVAAYTQAIDADPDLTDAYIGRAEAHRMLGELKLALADGNKAIALDPRSAWAHAERGEIYRLMERMDEAIADCNRAIELDPQLAWGYTIRGHVHGDNGDSTQAIADYRQSVRFDPEHAWTYRALAWELAYCSDEQYRDTKEAIHCAEKACKLTEWSNADMLTMLAAAYAEDGQLDQAVRYQQDALNLTPKDDRAELQEQLDEYRRQLAGADDPGS